MITGRVVTHGAFEGEPAGAAVASRIGSAIATRLTEALIAFTVSIVGAAWRLGLTETRVEVAVGVGGRTVRWAFAGRRGARSVAEAGRLIEYGSWRTGLLGAGRVVAVGALEGYPTGSAVCHWVGSTIPVRLTETLVAFTLLVVDALWRNRLAFAHVVVTVGLARRTII